MKRLVLITLVLSAVLGGSARAEPPVTATGVKPFDVRENIDLGIAARYWGTPTDCASLATERAAFLSVETKTYGGYTTIPLEAGTPCILRVVPGRWAYWECLLIVHEYGHLVGLPDTPNPDSIMNEKTLYEHYIPGCTRRWG